MLVTEYAQGAFLAASNTPLLFSDNIATTYIVPNPINHACSKRIKLDIHFVK